MGVAVGIDLGTTNSCMAVVQANTAKVVADQADRRIHPSVVSFAPDSSILAGHVAKDRQIIDSVNTIYSFKRLIGRDLNSPEMLKVIEDFPYDVKVGEDGICAIVAREREVSLPEVSAMMLKHLRELCTEMFGIEVNEAVITVPANFNDVQRASTKVAGRIAGFNVLRILNEPTAAALAYGFGGELTERIAIYDFGGGTFDITVVELADDIFEVLSTAGDTYLGGDDFDKLIVNEMQKDFQRESGIDLSDNMIATQRIRSVAEKVKCQLSLIDEVQATLREIAEDDSGTPVDFNFKLTRARFEKLIEPLVDRSIKVCEEALKLAEMDRSALDNLVLVGGTTRIPLVRTKVKEYFGKDPRVEINPDEVVAIGAAIQAFSLTGEQLPEKLPNRPPKVQAPRPPVSKAPPAAAQGPGAETAAPGAPKPYPLGPMPQNEPKSNIQKTLHGIANPPPAPGSSGTQAGFAQPAASAGERAPIAPPVADLPAPVGETRESILPAPVPQDDDLDLDVKRPKTPPPPAPGEMPLPGQEKAHQATQHMYATGVEAENLDLDVKKPPPPPPPMEPQQPTQHMWSEEDGSVGTGTGPTEMPAPAAPPPSPEEPPQGDDFNISIAPPEPAPDGGGDDIWGQEFGGSEQSAETPAPSPEPSFPEPFEAEPSEAIPAVLEAPEFPDEDFAPIPEAPEAPEQPGDSLGDSLGSDIPSPEDILSDFGTLGDMPIPGTENDEVVGLPAPAGAEFAMTAPQAALQEEEVHSEVAVPTASSAKAALLLDVTPRALGVATAGGFCDSIIDRNAAIPVEQSRLFSTSTTNQTEVAIDVYQGESRRVAENTKLGQVLLTNLRPATRGEIKVRVTFEIDTDGILGVSAENEETGEAESTRIVLTGGMDEEKVEELVQKYAE